MVGDRQPLEAGRDAASKLIPLARRAAAVGSLFRNRRNLLASRRGLMGEVPTRAARLGGEWQAVQVARVLARLA
jgi:hypothetical protein